MPDINFHDRDSGTNPLYLREAELRAGIELLFFAYRDSTSDSDEILHQYGFGRAHHRVIHFVGRHPGISVADLLKILRITKQSLSRVLKQLLEGNYVKQEVGQMDRRQRLLYLTPEGVELERRISAPQQARVARAFREAGPEAVAGYRKVLAHLINANERDEILRSLEKLTTP